MTKILFICHGNICRSPMAEFVMKNMVEQMGLASQFYIESAATSREEIGNPVYQPVRKLLSQHGIDTSGKTARQMTKADYDRFDYIVAMDSNNLRNMERIIGRDTEGKVSLLLDHAGIHRDVADPWYTRDFEATWNDVNIGCKALLEKIT
ncbi:MAG: low molecular weight phosphotyrosine protein phosphatase [Ruminococcaceae bacterium]|nr:low molecular weight phosphotyrosine protein phosphatase [Oscillospiraceae bacterium]